MAQKRMFDKNITCDDEFLELSAKAQALYFHIGMIADDDGLTKNYKLYMKALNADNNDLKSLIDKNFLYKFKSDIIVVKHWLINNTVRKDRYRQTIYQDEYNQIGIAENGEYVIINNDGLPSGNQLATQYSIVKLSKEKNSLVKDSVVENIEKSSTPTEVDNIPYEKIINCLKDNSGIDHDVNDIESRNLIKELYNNNHTEEEIYNVITFTCREWMGTDYEQYLRPKTLFRLEKFEQYLKNYKEFNNKKDCLQGIFEELADD